MVLSVILAKLIPVQKRGFPVEAALSLLKLRTLIESLYLAQAKAFVRSLQLRSCEVVLMRFRINTDHFSSIDRKIFGGIESSHAAYDNFALGAGSAA